MDGVIYSALEEHERMKAELVTSERLCDLKYADGVVCLFGAAESEQLTLNGLAKAVTPFGMCFLPSV